MVREYRLLIGFLSRSIPPRNHPGGSTNTLRFGGVFCLVLLPLKNQWSNLIGHGRPKEIWLNQPFSLGRDLKKSEHALDPV